MNDMRATGEPNAPYRKSPLPGLFLSLAGVIAVVAAIAGLAFLALSAVKGTDVYRLAWEKVRGDPQVAQALGEPLAEGWLASGEVQTEDDRGNAKISFGITGPNGSATVQVSGVRTESVWSLVSLKVILPSQPEPLVLIAPAVTPEATPETAPTKRRPDDTIWNARLANIPYRSLTHASRELVLRGKTRDYLRGIFGEPTEIRTASFEKLRYGQPPKLPAFDEQWIYRRSMGHIHIYIQNDLVVSAVEEWSDF